MGISPTGRVSEGEHELEDGGARDGWTVWAPATWELRVKASEAACELEEDRGWTNGHGIWAPGS